jgi:hypothetical protein
MLLLKMSRIVERDYLTRPAFYGDHTLFIEFARGVFDGGYRKAFELLSKPLLSRAAVLYIQVSFEESCRKNEARYQEKLAHSILAHKLPDEALERFSREQDFEKMVGGERSGYFELQGLRVPFVVMPNEPELKDPDALDVRYGEALRELMRLYEARA